MLNVEGCQKRLTRSKLATCKTTNKKKTNRRQQTDAQSDLEIQGHDTAECCASQSSVFHQASQTDSELAPRHLHHTNTTRQLLVWYAKSRTINQACLLVWILHQKHTSDAAA